MGHLCGYVGITSDHPLYGVDYSSETPALNRFFEEWKKQTVGDRGIVSILCASMHTDHGALTPELFFDVHGGITFSGQGGKYPTDEKDLWFFGFDCAHAGDTPENWTEDRCIAETERLAEQIAELSEIQEAAS
jgi:hypothetical protein